MAFGGARRTRTQRRFSTLAQSFCSHFLAKSHDFGGIALRFSQDAPKNAPRINWRPRNLPGRGWTTKSCFSTGFLGFFRDFWTSPDVSGSLWKLGRLGLEPRTKALKGFYQRPVLSLRVS